MNCDTFKVVDTAEMQREFEEAVANNMKPAQYIPVGGETRAERRARARIAAKAEKKLRRKLARA